MAMVQNGSLRMATPNGPGKEGQCDPQASTPMASQKFTSFQSYRAGADLTKSIENFGQNFTSNKGSGFNLLGQSSPEPAAKILSQLCRGDGVALRQESQTDVNRTLEQWRLQLLQQCNQPGSLDQIAAALDQNGSGLVDGQPQ